MQAQTLAEFLMQYPEWSVKAYSVDRHFYVSITGLDINHHTKEITILTTGDEIVHTIADQVAVYPGFTDSDQQQQRNIRDAKPGEMFFAVPGNLTKEKALLAAQEFLKQADIGPNRIDMNMRYEIITAEKVEHEDWWRVWAKRRRVTVSYRS